MIHLKRALFPVRHLPAWLLLAAYMLASPSALALSTQQAEQKTLSLMPQPTRFEQQAGYYQPAAAPKVTVSGNKPDALPELRALALEILQAAQSNASTRASSARASTGRQNSQGAEAADLTLRLDANAGANAESYVLRVDANGIALRAISEAGLFYGLQTLRQLLEQSDPKLGIGFVTIEDAPRFAWRGLHLDVGRHMFPVAYIKKQLDLMARYKFNTLHWHLTDDQGWRIEIKRYPKLTEVGGWRKQSAVRQPDGTFRYDGKPYGGFYTQAQAREIVEYARKLHITVVPEIEMPGHAVAALSAYPELGCTPGPFEAWVDWGVNDEVFCPSEKTFTFLEGVLAEVMEIFPSTYIHAGGDEAPITRWQQSELAQGIIKREGLKDEHALQGWFMRRIEKYLQQHDRRLLAWDEMLAGNPAQSTTIMAWRSVGEGIKAAQRGHDVVMTPVSSSYFDYCQSRAVDEPPCPNFLPLRKVYDFEPAPPELTPAQAKHVIGGQANLWTEHIRTEEHVEYMLWPRALAMSEVLWSPARARDWDGFMRRIGPQLAALDRLRVNYRIPEVLGLDGDVLSLTPQASVTLRSPLQAAQIVYTTDGSAPRADSARYETAIKLTLRKTPTVVSARLLNADGRLGPTMRASYGLTSLHPGRQIEQSALQPGLQRDYFEQLVENTDALLTAKPTRSDTATAVEIPDFAPQERFALRYRGVVDIPADGLYRFSLASDDGARVLIDGKLLIDRDRPKTPGESHGSVGLAKGTHDIELRYFQGGGDRSLQLEVSRDGAAPTSLPAGWLRHAR